MVAQKMGSQGGGIDDSNGENQIPTQDPIQNPLSRQGSLYNLTMDEVQSQLGDLTKPLGSMNLDELLKTVWSAEAINQATVGIDDELSSQSLNQHMLSMDLSKKTVEELWQGIQQGEKRGSSLDRKTTLGEMTLEDFLVKAGVVAESTAGKKILGSGSGGSDPTGIPHHAQWMNYQIPSVHPQPQQLPVFMQVQQPIPLGGNPMMEAGYPDTRISMSSPPLMGTLSDTQTPGRKRVAPGDIAERSVERRQKRMIKNRESAARSRARKQVVFCLMNLVCGDCFL